MIFIIIIIGVILFFLLLQYKSPYYKGRYGESKVAWQLSKLNESEYKVINDILIKTSNGTSQIDHIVVSIYGLFVIETKNYSGWIHGYENSDYWVQSIYKEKNKFRNPIKQNWSHIYALKEILSEYKNISYYPIVVFAGSGELKNVTANHPVIYDYQLYDCITSQGVSQNLSFSEVEYIENKLKNINIEEKQVRKAHVSQIYEKEYVRREKEKLLICPRCGNNLIFRNGKYGNFYGCGSYPKCKYTKKI